MKFSCDRCQTRYSIGDEKVRGKVLKIRCKTCGNIIVVREATAVGEAAYAAAAAASSGAGAPRAQPPVQQKPAGGPEPEWFVAIKGQQHGPVRKDDVIRWLREGRISDRSFLWNETLPAWSRLRELPDFQAALQAAQEPAGRRGPPPPPPSEEGAEVVNLEQARQQRMAREGQAPPASDPFAAVGNGPGAAADNAPRDSTRVFIMQAGLHNRSKKHQVVAAVAGVVILLLGGLFILDWKGVIEIPGLHGVVNVVTGNTDAPKDDGFALLGFDEVAPPDSDPCHLRGDCKPIKVARKSAPRSGGGGGLNLAGGGGVGDINMDGQNTADPGTGGAVLRSDDQLVGLDPVEIAKLRGVVGQGPGPTGPRAPSQAPAIPIDDVRLSPEVVKQVVESKRGGYEDCVASGQKGGEPLPAGKLKVAFVVENTGKVSSVAFAPSRVAAMGAGQCIIKLVKHLRFPTFQGAPEEAEFSLIIQ